MTEDSRPSPNTVQLASQDVAASIAFYQDICGFTLAEQWPDKNPMWARLDLDGQSLMVGLQGKPEQIATMCKDDPAEAAWHLGSYEDVQKSQVGAGVVLYFHVADADAFHAEVQKRGGKPATSPKTQFYGLRDFGIQDPDGYRIVFYHPVTMENCQSCAMPLADAKPGDMYCDYCTDEKGQLRPFEDILAGTTGYFEREQGMDKASAEAAAREHLLKMPAWVCANA